jgi:mannose-6-phosphate isomerase-like protein (cupin superfamily)
MNAQEYIDSGVLYDYCINELSDQQRLEVELMCAQFPEIQKELTSLQGALGNFAGASAITPAPAMQENIWSKLDNINRENTGDIKQLPIINKYSDYNNWKKIVLSFMPADLTTERTIKTIRDSGGVTQMLVFTRTDVEEEVHENEQESFIILEGECECHIGNQTYRLGPGAFLEIPLHATHNVRVISPYVLAVLQHVAV